MPAMTSPEFWGPPGQTPFGAQQRVPKSDRITVGIAADDVLIRMGIRDVLDQVGEFEVVGDADDGPGAVWLAMTHRPRIMFMDAALAGMPGPKLVETVRGRVPTVQVVVLAAAADHALLLAALRAGAAGFLFKDGDPGELLSAIRVAVAGGTYLSPAAARLLIDHLVSAKTDRRDEARKRIALLTDREREVLRYVRQGLGNARIARMMYLSEGAVKVYVSRVLAKLRCDNRVQAALIAHQAALT